MAQCDSDDTTEILLSGLPDMVQVRLLGMFELLRLVVRLLDMSELLRFVVLWFTSIATVRAQSPLPLLVAKPVVELEPCTRKQLPGDRAESKVAPTHGGKSLQLSRHCDKLPNSPSMPG